MYDRLHARILIQATHCKTGMDTIRLPIGDSIVVFRMEILETQFRPLQQLAPLSNQAPTETQPTTSSTNALLSTETPPTTSSTETPPTISSTNAPVSVDASASTTQQRTFSTDAPIVQKRPRETDHDNVAHANDTLSRVKRMRRVLPMVITPRTNPIAAAIDPDISGTQKTLPLGFHLDLGCKTIEQVFEAYNIPLDHVRRRRNHNYHVFPCSIKSLLKFSQSVAAMTRWICPWCHESFQRQMSRAECEHHVMKQDHGLMQTIRHEDDGTFSVQNETTASSTNHFPGIRGVEYPFECDAVDV